MDAMRKLGSKFFGWAAILATGFFSAVSAWAGPNLTPFAPTGWSDKIVITRTNGGIINSSNLLTTDSLYLDWSVINSGNANVTSPFVVALNIDGVQNQTWSFRR
jgi:hypothetical protein